MGVGWCSRLPRGFFDPSPPLKSPSEPPSPPSKDPPTPSPSPSPHLKRPPCKPLQAPASPSDYPTPQKSPQKPLKAPKSPQKPLPYRICYTTPRPPAGGGGGGVGGEGCGGSRYTNATRLRPKHAINAPLLHLHAPLRHGGRGAIGGGVRGHIPHPHTPPTLTTIPGQKWNYPPPPYHPHTHEPTPRPPFFRGGEGSKKPLSTPLHHDTP